MSSRSKSASMNQANRLNVIGQSNLKICQPNDKYEQEADRVAEQVIGMTSPASSRIQRHCASCEDEHEQLQRKQKYHITPGITASFHSDIHSLKNKGQSVPASERNFFEPRFSADFSQVRLHNDSDSTQMAQAINARAFTIGTDIVSARGEYSPNSMSGRKLLAHELTHVLQQSGTKAANITHYNEPGNRVQRDFAVEPGTPVTEASQLSETEIASAIRYNRARFFDESELRLMRDVLGIPEEPAVIDQNFVLAVARYQQQFGETIDGKVGRDSALTLSQELHAESSLVSSLARPARELSIRGRSTETANNVDSGGRTDIFDASLDHSNARLTLAMRVNFNYVNGGGGSRVTTDNATPFTDAMRTITGQNWTAIMYRTLT